MALKKTPWAKCTKTERNNNIRRLYSTDSSLSMADLGRMYKISRVRIFQIIYGGNRKPNLSE